MQQLAILGGTFDPVHCGHLLMAETAGCQFSLDQVLWSPIPFPPHKSQRIVTDYTHRRRMIELAIAHRPEFQLVDLDPNVPQANYAITILRQLQRVYPQTRWFWILGLDAFQSLPRWYCRQELAALCDWLIAPRGIRGKTCYSSLCTAVADRLAAESIPIRWHLLEMPDLPISSSLIRQSCQEKSSRLAGVPDPVREYIRLHHLYKPGSDSGIQIPSGDFS